jgi:sulfur-oxidizing protein SoxZ
MATGQPSRIRATAQAGGAVVRVLMTHDMESGQRKDASGRTIAAWHITEVTATLNARVIFTAHWGPGVAKNPYLQFTVRGAKVGERVGIAWTDNRGDSRSDEVLVS